MCGCVAGDDGADEGGVYAAQSCIIPRICACVQERERCQMLFLDGFIKVAKGGNRKQWPMLIKAVVLWATILAGWWAGYQGHTSSVHAEL